MARAKSSAVIVARLIEQGYTVHRAPKANPYHMSMYARANGTPCWTATVEKGGVRADLLCWDTMVLCAAVPLAKWWLRLNPWNPHTLTGGDYELSIVGSTCREEDRASRTVRKDSPPGD